MHESFMAELPTERCVELLRNQSVGRIAVMYEGYPVVFPVNYRVVMGVDGGDQERLVWVALRTHPGNIIDRALRFVSFEIDHIDPVHHLGWSVLVTGTLHHVDEKAAEFAARFDPQPWLTDGRDQWLVVEPTRVTGRQIVEIDDAWAFSPSAYL
jgi:nitroimidazol reductase NimA-like FMN-containing flavoprotein (pyridoxamine 5'-phosphate oxidase superfamily)